MGCCARQTGLVSEPIPGPEELAAAGLYDPLARDAARRLELLQFIAGLGATIEEMQEAGAALPVLALVLPLLGRGERFGLIEAAERSGVPVEMVIRFWRATGFADPGDAPVFRDEDVVMLRTLSGAVALLGEDAVLQLARAVGSATSRMAEAAASLFVVNVGRPALTGDPGGLDLARANAAGAQLIPALEQAVGIVLRRHLAAIRRPPEQIMASADGFASQQVAVGFVDLVDSTVMSRILGPTELARAITAFEAEVADVVTAKGGRLVKLIGDEAMFVTTDPVAACEIALDLARGFHSHPVLPPVRSGLAHGDVTARDGDYFGPVVTLAARATKAADPGTVLVTSEMADLLTIQAAPFELTRTHEENLKGFEGTIALYTLSRPSD